MTPFQFRMKAQDAVLRGVPHTPPDTHLSEGDILKVRREMEILYLEALSTCPRRPTPEDAP